jgi:hypothetical protein
MTSATDIPIEASAGQRQKRRHKQNQNQKMPITNNSNATMNSNSAINYNSSRFLATVVVLHVFLFLARSPFAANAWVVPNTPRSQLQGKRTAVVSGLRTRSSIPLASPSSSLVPSSSSSSLCATLEDNKSEEEQSSGPAPRRTRRIDDILDEYESTGDAGLTISVLESSLKREQEKSSTLAIRLAYAEQIIAEQKKRLEAKRSTLQKKTQALSETQKRLQNLEEQLKRNGQPIPQALQRQLQRQAAPPPVQSQSQAPWQQTPLTSKQRQYPLITNWSINRNSGEVTGSVSSHPSIPDGTTIVTSGLNQESFLMAAEDFVFDRYEPATVVTTRSGSMYQLGVKKVRRQSPPRNPAIPATFQQQQHQQQIQGEQQLHPANNLNPNLQFPLTGQSISNGRGTKYLLAGEPKRKPSGRSEIIMAYKCDDKLRVCDSVTPYIVKLSTQRDKLRREYENFQLVQEQTVDKNKNNGWIGGAISNMFDPQEPTADPFVSCYDFLPFCEGSIKYAQHSAIVLEKGHEDLRDYEYRLQIQDDPEYPTHTTMEPEVVRCSLLVAAKCLHVLHSRARLVWTDLKAENLIFMEPFTSGENNVVDVEIKGVDLESAIPHRGHPLDYTPEACPPEFAQLHLRGNAYDFVLEYSYDVWSFGMLAYELATGSAYFKGKIPSEIMAILGDPDFLPPLENNDMNMDPSAVAVVDKELRDLIRACLKVDPRQRISVGTILAHSYFQNMQQQQLGATEGSGGFGGGGTFW